MVERKTPSKSADASGRLNAAFIAMADASVTEIAGDFPVSLNAVSKRIKMLERAELVRRTMQARDHILSLDADAMADATEWIEYYHQFWDDPLASLEKAVINQRNSARKGKPT